MHLQCAAYSFLEMDEQPPGGSRPLSGRRRKEVSTRYMRERWERFLSQDSRGFLMVEGIAVDRIAQKYGTPLYLYVESEIRERMRRFKAALPPPVRLQYAVKCNSNLEILRMAREEGFELDCSSVGELILGLLADFHPRQLSFTNLVKTEHDVHFAAKIGVQAITADSIEDLALIASAARKLRVQVRTVLRVNPMIDVGAYSTKGNKYGIPLAMVDRAIALATAAPYVDFRGFHFMGGYVGNARVFRVAARAMLKIVKRCTDRGIRVRTLSLGGGFPAAIGDGEAFPIEAMWDFPLWFERLRERQGIPPLQLIFEPGKSIVLNAGMGLMKVVAHKRLGRRERMIIVDGSTYNFVPDALVQEDVRYDVLPASKMNAPRVHAVTIGGSTCDCWDLLTRDRELPKLEHGDLLAIMDAGGYAQVMASNFNTIKRAAVALVRSDGTVKLIRRRDRYSEMFAPELDVLKVADPNELERYTNLHRVNIDRVWKGAKRRRRREQRRFFVPMRVHVDLRRRDDDRGGIREGRNAGTEADGTRPAPGAEAAARRIGAAKEGAVVVGTDE